MEGYCEGEYIGVRSKFPRSDDEGAAGLLVMHCRTAAEENGDQSSDKIDPSVLSAAGNTPSPEPVTADDSNTGVCGLQSAAVARRSMPRYSEGRGLNFPCY
ncbi:hypothetical protein IWW39_003713 [Coemansia spiralis]|uniref:Uncharacterized protein n=1 Tax=Coemansia spiralis TaxID=417178 RepID=A0A9W8GHU6_9FUNG|nr:hypothetical protein IWW39_003713 [Coemansia spiralis]